MSVIFVFNEVTNMEVPTGKEIPLEKALLLLDKQNKIALNQNVDMSCSYSLLEDESNIFSSSLVFPQETFSLYETIYLEIESDDFEGKEVFINWLNQVFSVKKSLKKNQRNRIREPQEKKQQKEWKIDSQALKKVALALLLIIATASIVIVSSLVYGSINQVPKLDTLLDEKKYLEAAEQYPEEKRTIENELFELIRTKDQTYLDDLKQYNEKYPTVQGTFDLAMFDGKYQTAITVYEENMEEFSEDSVRSTLAGYAYLKRKSVESAEKILEATSSTELEKYIYNYKQLVLLIQEKEETIDSLQKEPSKNEKLIEQTINELFDTKEQLENF